MIRDIRNLFEQGKDYMSNFWNSHFIEFASNGDRNKIVSINEFLDVTKSYLKDIINNLKKSDTWKIYLTIAINFIFPKDIDEKSVMHSKIDNIEIMTYDKADEFIKKINWIPSF